MAHCKECKHSVFDKVWGEFKCKKYMRRIYNPSYQPENCPKFEERKKKEK